MTEFIVFVVNPIILILLVLFSFPVGEYFKEKCSIRESIKRAYSNLLINSVIFLCCTPCLILIISYICLKI